MTQSSAQTWCDQAQARLMAALDAIWASVEGVDDPVLIRKARDKAKLCGEMAATVRKIAAMTPIRKPSPAFPGLPDDPEPRPARGIDRLKGGGRGRL
jgi:hypothetical protein